MNLDYEIIATGSKGNAVRIENILIDSGVPYKLIKESLYDVDYLLYTHRHSDHYKESTLKNIRKNFPDIKVAMNYELAQIADIEPDIIFNESSFDLDGLEIHPFACVHDVITHGFTFELDGLSIIYATDTNTLKNAPKQKYDYLFLECNYDKNKVTFLDKMTPYKIKKSYGYDPRTGLSRHMATQDTKAFYYMNRRSEESILIPLHMSSRFY